VETTDKKPEEPKPWYQEITQPFKDLVHAPRALWGVNLAYGLEGLSYFGILTYLAMHFSDYIFKGVEHADIWSHNMVMVLTAGIAISMVVLGFIPDKLGPRRVLLGAFVVLVIGRVLMAAAPTVLGMQPNGLWSALHLTTMAGIFFVLIGYGVYQPAAYSAVRQLTTPKTAEMGYAMLYALMNAGSSLVMLAFLLRDEEFLGLGIPGMFWIFTGITVVSLLATFFLLTPKTMADAIAKAKTETDSQRKATEDAKSVEQKKSDADAKQARTAAAAAPAKLPVHVWVVLALIIAAAYWRLGAPWSHGVAALVVLVPVVIALLPRAPRTRVVRAIATHPLANTKFFFFIFALMPVQTLFTYNWLVLPQYIERSYAGWIGRDFEFASNLNPVLIFVLVPVITALTIKTKVYSAMIWGTLVMASSAFFLAFGANIYTLVAYVLMMTVGEAIWSARFLGYATSIAPEGQAGQYQGVAQLPWFLTKFLVPLLYSGVMMERYCPTDGPKNTEKMWFIFGLIAIISPILLIVAKRWVGSSLEKKQTA